MSLSEVLSIFLYDDNNEDTFHLAPYPPRSRLGNVVIAASNVSEAFGDNILMEERHSPFLREVL